MELKMTEFDFIQDNIKITLDIFEHELSIEL